MSLPGHPVTEAELTELGFIPLCLEVKRELPALGYCDWDTMGQVPEGPGHYLFSVEAGSMLSVTYVGLTTHLSMVTKGRLPRGAGARGGQRYGRPTNAGDTRRRINSLVTGCGSGAACGTGSGHFRRPRRRDRWRLSSRSVGKS